MKRDKSLDIAKGIAIILMMYGHLRYTVQNMDTAYSWIYSFHMPFFIYITGLLTTVKSENPFIRAGVKLKKILIPYVCWNIVGFFINHMLGLQNQSLQQFVHGVIIGDNLISNLPTWYLLSFLWITLFIIFVLPLLDTRNRLVFAAAVAAVLVLIVGYFPQMQDYFRWKGAVVLLPFFIAGYLAKKMEFHLPGWLLLPFLYIGFKLGRVNAVRSWGYVTVGNGSIGVPYLYLLSAIFTITAMIEICRYLAKIPAMEMVAVFGRHSLVILCTHWILGNIIGRYLEYGWGLFLTVFVMECAIVGGCEWFAKKQSEKRKVK